MAIQTFGGKPLLDPLEAYRQCVEAELDTSWWGKPNSYRCYLGCKPGTGHLLMLRRDLAALSLSDLHSLSIQITEEDLRGTRTLPPRWVGLIVLQGLVVVGYESITPGLRGDENEALLVEIADQRALLAKVPINEGFNVPTVPDNDYYGPTTNGGTPWTWDEVGQAVWETVGTDWLGDWPGLPLTPDGTPENFRFYGMSAWEALGQFLAHVGCAVRYDPFLAEFSIVEIGASDTDFDTWLEDWDGFRIWDSYGSTVPRAQVPEKVRVLFRKNPPPPYETPFHIVDVAVGSPYVDSGYSDTGTVHQIYDSKIATYDSGGSLTNSSDLNDRANERATQYARQLGAGLDPLKIRFALPCPDSRCLPGQQIWWTEWSERGGGWITEVSRQLDVPAESLMYPPVEYDHSISLTVKEQDGSPSYTGITEIQVDQSDGLTLTQPGTGQVLVSIQPASSGQAGIVTDDVQSFGGTKTFHAPLGTYFTHDSNYVSIQTGTSGTTEAGSLVLDPATDGRNSIGVTFSTDIYNTYAVNFSYGANNLLAVGKSDFIETFMVLGAVGVSATTGGLTFTHGLYTGGTFSGGSGTVTSVTLTQPAAGLTITNSGVSQTTAASGTFALANDLAALEALTGTNTIYYRSGADTWSAVTVSTGLSFSGGTLSCTLTGLSDGDKGDITVSGSGATWTIDPGVVTYAKMQNVSATSRVLARKTSGAGDVEECTLSEVLDFVGSAARGDILYRGASTWTRLPAGTSGQLLQTGGSGGNPSWVDSPAIPAGAVQMWAGGSPPPGWLGCNGAAVSRTTYADLFAAIGTVWGAGDGSTTFNVPDLRGRAPIGAGTGTGLTARTRGQTGGSETHTLTESEMPAHTHNVFYDGDTGAVPYPQLNFGTDPPGAFVTSSSTGGGSAHNNMQPWAAINFIIKT